MYSIRAAAQKDPSETHHLLKLLDYTRDFCFGDERDRIYGLLVLQSSGAAATESETLIEPDYAADKLEAYKKAAVKCLVQKKRIKTLLSVHHEHGIDDDRPSWVPHWKEWSWVDLHQNYRRASGSFETIKIEQLNEDREAICIRGMRVDAVKTVIGGHTHQHSNEHLQSLLGRLCAYRSQQRLVCG